MKNKKMNLYHCNCKPCQKEYKAAHYSANRQDYYNRNKRYKAEIKEKIDFLKSESCTDCKNCFPPICMDFDHVRGEKSGNVSALVGFNSLRKVLNEIEKCELVCANCHRIRTEARQRQI